jgi:hypothetical protein
MSHVQCYLHMLGFYCFFTQVHLDVFFYTCASATPKVKIPTIPVCEYCLLFWPDQIHRVSPAPSFPSPPPPVRPTRSLTSYASRVRPGKSPRHLQHICSLIPVPGGGRRSPLDDKPGRQRRRQRQYLWKRRSLVRWDGSKVSTRASYRPDTPFEVLATPEYRSRIPHPIWAKIGPLPFAYPHTQTTTTALAVSAQSYSSHSVLPNLCIAFIIFWEYLNYTKSQNNSRSSGRTWGRLNQLLTYVNLECEAHVWNIHGRSKPVWFRLY